MVQLRHAVSLCGNTHFVLTKPDVLDELDEINICVGYNIDGAETDRFPMRYARLQRAEPVYETLPGWKQSISECRAWDDLPENARNYIQRIEELAGVPIAIVSVGPGREQTIVRDNPLA